MMSTANEAAKSTSSSSFAPRPSTTVPPASQTFEPLVRSVLSDRLLYKLFVHSAAFSLVSTVLLAGGDNANFVLRLFWPSTWFHAVMAWTVGVIPVLVARKSFLAPTPNPAPSPSKTMTAALSNPETRRWIAVYVTCSLSLLFLEFNRVWFDSDDVRLSLFMKSRKHPYYLNGRLIFLALAQMWLALSFALRNVMRERLSLRWEKVQLSLGAPFLLQNIALLLLTVSLFTLASFALFNLAFGLARLILLPLLLRVPLVRSLLKPFIGHFVRGPWTLTLPWRYLFLETHAFFLGLYTLVNWEFAEELFDVYIPQPATVGAATVDPNVTLVSGITSTDPLYLYFAYAELRNVALDSHASIASRRTALFSDQKFSPSLWSTLARQSLLRLGQDYQTFLRKGALAPAKVAAPTAAPKTASPPSTPLLRKAIFKAPQQSPMSRVLDTLSSGADVSQPAVAVASEVSAGATDSSIPELFRSTSSASASAPAPPPPPTATATPPHPSVFEACKTSVKAQCEKLIVQHSPPWSLEVAREWNEWWRRDRIHKLTEKSLPNRDLDALIVQVLAGLVCASLTEDRYGVVQRDIPRILEALLSFLTALEEHQVELTKQFVPPTPEEVTRGEHKVLKEKERTRVEVAKASEAIGVVTDALKSGVADIARTFGEKLVAFKFPPRTAQKLQAFVDYA